MTISKLETDVTSVSDTKATFSNEVASEVTVNVFAIPTGSSDSTNKSPNCLYPETWATSETIAPHSSIDLLLFKLYAKFW